MVSAAEWAEPLARVLADLGTRRVWAVHGSDGLDEITTTTTTTIAHVRGGSVEIEHFDPRSVGIERADLEDLQAGDLDEAAGVIRSILAGEPGPKADIAVLNAAAALESGDRGLLVGGELGAGELLTDRDASTLRARRQVVDAQDDVALRAAGAVGLVVLPLEGEPEHGGEQRQNLDEVGEGAKQFPPLAFLVAAPLGVVALVAVLALPDVPLGTQTAHERESAAAAAVPGRAHDDEADPRD